MSRLLILSQLLIFVSFTLKAQIGHQDTITFSDGRSMTFEVLDLAAADYADYHISMGPGVGYFHGAVAAFGQLHAEALLNENIRLEFQGAGGLVLGLPEDVNGREIASGLSNFYGNYGLSTYYILRKQTSRRPVSMVLEKENHGDFIRQYETSFVRPVLASFEIMGGLGMINRPLNYGQEGMSLRPNEIAQRGLDSSLFYGLHNLSNINLEIGIASRTTSSAFYAKNSDLSADYRSGMVYAKMLLALSRELSFFSFDDSSDALPIRPAVARVLPGQDGEGILGSAMGVALGGQLVMHSGKGYQRIALNLELWPHLNRQSAFAENFFASLSYTYGFGSSVRKRHAREIMKREN